MDVAGRSPAAGRLDLARLVTHRFPPGRTDEASTAAVAEPEGSGTVVVTRAELSAPESSGATR